MLFPAIVAFVMCLGVGTAIGEEPPRYLLEWSVPHRLGFLGAPWNVTVDSGFNVLVTQTQPNQLDWYSTPGVLSLTSNLSAGACTPYPGGVSVGPDGSIYVALAGCNRIAKLDRTLTTVGVWGGVGTGNGQFIVPLGVAADPLGNVFVADTYNNRIQKFDGAGAYLGQWGHFGTTPGDLQNPFALACDSSTVLRARLRAGPPIVAELSKGAGVF